MILLENFESNELIVDLTDSRDVFDGTEAGMCNLCTVPKKTDIQRFNFKLFESENKRKYTKKK